MDSGWYYADGYRFQITSDDQFTWDYNRSGGTSITSPYTIHVDGTTHDQVFTIKTDGLYSSYNTYLRVNTSRPPDPFLLPQRGSFCNSLLRSMRQLFQEQ